MAHSDAWPTAPHTPADKRVLGRRDEVPVEVVHERSRCGYLSLVERRHNARDELRERRPSQRLALHDLWPRQRAHQALERRTLLDIPRVECVVSQLTQPRAFQVRLRQAVRRRVVRDQVQRGADPIQLRDALQNTQRARLLAGVDGLGSFDDRVALLSKPMPMV